MKKTNNKKTILRKLIFLSSTLALSLAAVLFIIFGINSNESIKDELSLEDFKNSYYNNEQAQISSANTITSSSYISMTDAASANSNNGKTITIKDGDELYLFSQKCQSTPAFRAYNYILTTNIDYYDIESDFIPIAYTGAAFTGSFNGQGYEISDLHMQMTNASQYSGIKYFSMFSVLGTDGIITNLGLVDPTISITNHPDDFGDANGGVSYLVGENNGTVSYSYIIDDKEPANNKSGIAAINCNIATLCVENKKKLEYNYVLIGTVVNKQTTDYIEFNEIALRNSGTITSNFYYNFSISSIADGMISYKDVFDIDDKPDSGIGTWCNTLPNLYLAITGATTGWYTSSNYGTLANYTKITYPIRRGITYSNNKFTVANEWNFAYMFELFNTDDYFASDKIEYDITVNLDLSIIPVSAYTYKKAIAANIKGIALNSGNPTFIDGQDTKLPTIYNADVMASSRVTKSTGVDCYGLFNYVTGVVENLNIVPLAMDLGSVNTVDTSNVKGIGAVAGYVEGNNARITNVNVYATITNTGSKNIGEYYVGGIAGILGGGAKIDNSTTAGSINLAASSVTLPNSKYMGGVAIGGVVGYIESSLGAVYTCLNAMNITAYLGANVDYAIGGVIGAGYTNNYGKDSEDNIIYTSQLENLGTITVGDSSNQALTYKTLYVSGVIGKLFGIAGTVGLLSNLGNVTVYANTNEAYISGVMNASILTDAVSNTGLTASPLKGIDGSYMLYTSSLLNGANVSVLGACSNIQYTDVLNVKDNSTSTYKFTAEIKKLYNVAYNKKYNGGSNTKTKNTLGDQTIDLIKISKFAPVLNVVGNTNSSITADTLYNLRNINYTFSATPSKAYTWVFTGVALGENINYENIRNEGNLTYTFDKAIETASTLNVAGLFDTLSNGFKASNLYNAGDIDVKEPSTGSTSSKTVDIYLAGICYQNLSEDSSIYQNPLNHDFDSSLAGTLSNVINNGDIKVESGFLKTNVAINVTPGTAPHFVSNVYIGGITYTNKGIISNAFNLGDIDISLYSSTAKRYEAGGISCIMDGQYAQIRDAANNGDVTVVDMGGKVTKIDSYVNAAGIVAKNTGTTTNNSEIIAFTINYGTIIGFLARDNMDTTAYANAHSVASGVLATGFCNMINIVNYGNVYGKECVAGVFGIVRLGLFSNSYTTTIANTINYAQVRIIPPYDNSVIWLTYERIVGLETYLDQNDANILRTHAGSICSIFDFSTRNNVKIRYLINLYTEVTVFASLNNPSTAPDISTFITARGATDEFGGGSNKIKYAPLSAVEDELGNIGVFSKDFIFRKAIDGIGLDSREITDLYISDFFQFVKFDKVNSVLLDSIGWRTIAYNKAAEDLVKNVAALAVLVTAAGSDATTLLADAYSSNTWLENCDLDVLDSLISSSLDDNALSSSITEILNYVLFDTTANSTYTQEIRIYIIDKILEYYNKAGITDYYTILQSMLYDTLFAKIIAEDNVNYKAVKDKIKAVLEDSTNLETVLNTYIELLKTNTSIISELFSGGTQSYYETPKINLVTTLLTGYDEYTLEAIYNALNLTPADEDSSIAYKLYLQNHQTEAANIYAHLVLNNSLSSNANYLSWVNTSLEKYDLATMLDSSSMSGTVDNFGNITDLTGYKYTAVTTNAEFNSTAAQLKTINNFVTKNITSLDITPTKDYRNLWNIIKNDSSIQQYIANNYFETVTNPTTNTSESGIIAKATEYTNTYQTNDRTMSDYAMNYGYTHSAKGDEFYEIKLDGSTKYYGGINYGYNNDKYYSFFDGNGFGNDNAIKTRFIYTPDDYVTYRTNYLGPYATTTGIVYDQKITSNGSTYFSSNAYGYKKGANLAAVDESTSTTRGTVPVFISINENLIKNKIAESGTNAGSTLYKYHWNNHNGGGLGTDASSDYMWKQENFVTYAASNTTGYLYKNYNSGTYMCDYYNFDPTYVPTQRTDYNTSNTLPNGVTTRLTNQEGQSHTYKDYYLTAYCSAAIITGLYYTYSSWPNGSNKCVSLLSKRDGTYAWNSVSGHTSQYCGVHTTDYICYKIADLVKLDGYKTKGFNQSLVNNNDEDETNIIGAICEKLLTDNKKLVLKAIYNYSVDNDFTASDTTTLNLLLTSVSDTEYAYSSVTESITSLVNMNYSGIQTIGTYLSTLNTSLTNYKDKIITSTVSNQANFKNLLLITLDDYSKKCSEFSTYNIYNRDDVNNFIYNYLDYVYKTYGAVTATQIDTILSAVADSDLQNLEDLLTHVTHTSIYFDYDNGYAYNDVFSIYDATLYNSNYPNYSSLYDNNYSRVLVGGEQSEIDFITGNFQYGYTLEITYKGTISIDNNTQTSNTVTTYSFNNLSRNSNYILFLSENTEVYDIKLYNSAYSGLSDTITSATNAYSPFASVDGTQQFSNTNFVQDGDASKHTMQYGHYYSNIWRNGNRATDSDMYLKFTKGSNITYNSIIITYKVLTCYQYNTFNFNFYMLYNSNGSKATSQYYDTYDNVVGTYDNITITPGETYNNNIPIMYQYSYSYTLPSALINLLNNQDIYLTINLEKDATNRNYNGQFSINDLIITYDFDFVNNEEDNTTSNVVFSQNLFNPYYSNTYRSSYTITNSNNYCGVDISGGSSLSQSLTFTDDSPTTVSSTNTKQINASLLFEPWYYPNITYPASLSSHLNFSTIEFGGDSLKENFEAGKYNISDVAKYISKDYIVEVEENTPHNYQNESFIEFYITGTGNITIYDSEDLEIDSINISTAQDRYEFYEYVISSGNYKFVLDNGLTLDYALSVPTNVGFDYSASAGIDTLKVVSGDDEKILLSFDYSRLSDPLATGASTVADSNINVVGASQLSDFNNRDGNTTVYDNYSMFYEVYSYYRSYNTTLTTTELRENDIFNSIITLMATIHQDSTNSSYYSIFKDSTFGTEELIEVIRLLCIADNKNTPTQDSAYKKLVDGLSSTYYKDLLLDFNKTAIKVNIAKKIYSIGSTNSNVAKYIYAAYLGNDYLDHNNLYTESLMYSLLNTFNDGEHDAGYYQFILTNTSVSAEKVTLLINYLSNNSNINIDGYGIFALSSSEGIGYGIFIPDNMDLSELDAEYDSSLELTETKNASWRGGSDITQGASGTVDYAFYHDMKQLIQSISTEIFVLDLVSGNNKYYSVDDQIDSRNKTITYYISNTDYVIINSLSSFTIDQSTLKLANGAHLSTTTISLSGSNVTKVSGVSITIDNAFIVYAEDASVSATYKIQFIVITPILTSLTATPNNIGYAGGTVTLTLVGSNFVDGVDVEPYLSVIVDNTTYSTEDGYWRLDKSVINNGIVSSNTATIVIKVDTTLPGGTVTFRISIFGQTVNADITKTKNTNKIIEEFGFEGHTITMSAGQANAAKSEILYGRAYNYSELTDYTSKSFYLYLFKYSANATVSITAEKSIDDTTGLMTYTVIFTITAESGGTPNVYYHKLEEKNYFDESTSYAAIYADGDDVGETANWDALDVEDRYKYLSGGTLTYNIANDTYDSVNNKWSLEDDMKAEISFNRGYEPQFRIKYVLNNFYTLGMNVVWAPTDETNATAAALSPSYAGLTVTVSDNINTGTYTFVYTYTNTGTWIDENDDEVEYTRYYEFPELVIIKMAATDALLHQLTFLEESLVLGNTATVIFPENVVVPDKSDIYDPDDNPSGVGYGDDDIIYQTAFESTTRQIRVTAKGIVYSNGSDARNISDYYAIGTVSDADLSYYCPTFEKNQYAQMYQYTTTEKLTAYGAGSQVKKDEEILGNHTYTNENRMYLYAPFVNTSTNENAVLLIELDSTGNWVRVFDTEYDGSLTNISSNSHLLHTYSDEFKTLDAKDFASFAGYRFNSDAAGEATDNYSLYMDYIGTPRNGHFWYVSYVIFSEDNLSGGETEGNIRYYHISIIDATNNIQFYVTIYSDTTLDLTDLYLTISENIYTEVKNGNQTTTVKTTRQISAYAVDSNTTYSGARTDISGYKIYNLKFLLQTLPKGYFYFYIDLPNGYVASAYTDMTNQVGESTDSINTKSTVEGQTVITGPEKNAFLPYTSIITQKINLEIVIDLGTGEAASAWAVNTTDIFTRNAEYKGTIPTA